MEGQDERSGSRTTSPGSLPLIRHRLPALLVAVATIAAACTGADTAPAETSSEEERPAEAAPDAATEGEPAPEEQGDPPERQLRELAPRTVGPLTEPLREVSVGCEEGRFVFHQDGCEPAAMIDLAELVSGGPPPDGIPSIDEPRFESVEEAGDWLTERSPVVLLELGGTQRLYPLAILTHHEIVNDEVAGDPVAVTYCPLCNSALAFERTIEGPEGPEVLEFGTSGRLWRSNLVMYDREHLGLWSQFTGQAIVGERFLGQELERLPTSLLGFGSAAELVPDAEVLSRDTGHDIDYGRNRYVGYDRVDNDPPFLRGDADDRLAPMTRVVGIGRDTESVAVVLDHLADERVVDVEVAGEPITVWWAPGQASALDRRDFEESREVGQAVAFSRRLGDQQLTFAPAGDGTFTDDRSGSTWNLRGVAVDGPLEGERLTPIARDDTLWFAWAVYRPDTTIVEGA